MAETFSVERRKLMLFLGAKVVLTPAALRGMGMVTKATELAKAHGWFLTRQFENEANADMHSRTTAVEILEDFKGERLDYWVTGFGTGGTLKGVGRVLRKERPDTKIIVCEPDNAQLLASGVEQVRNPDGSPAGSHPSFSPHPMQGWNRTSARRTCRPGTPISSAPSRMRAASFSELPFALGLPLTARMRASGANCGRAVSGSAP